MTRSALMKAYNAARKSHKFDTGRLNRALGVAQSKRWTMDGGTMTVNGKSGTHHTTKHGCDCQDCQYRHTVCKHQIALMLIAKAYYIENRTSAPALKMAA